MCRASQNPEGNSPFVDSKIRKFEGAGPCIPGSPTQACGQSPSHFSCLPLSCTFLLACPSCHPRCLTSLHAGSPLPSLCLHAPSSCLHAVPANFGVSPPCVRAVLPLMHGSTLLLPLSVSHLLACGQSLPSLRLHAFLSCLHAAPSTLGVSPPHAIPTVPLLPPTESHLLACFLPFSLFDLRACE